MNNSFELKRKMIEICIQKFFPARNLFDTLGKGPDYYFYDKTMCLYRETQNIGKLLFNTRFLESVYATLVSWGMNRRGAKLKAFNRFKENIESNIPFFLELSKFKIGKSTRFEKIKPKLKKLYLRLDIMNTNGNIVSKSNLMHFLLPDLILPIDFENTQTFFYGNSESDPLTRFLQIQEYAWGIAADFDLEKYVDLKTWNKSVPKVIDNAILSLQMGHSVGLYSLEQIRDIIEGYKNIKPIREYKKFLQDVSKCTNCASSNKIKKEVDQPFNLLVNPLDLTEETNALANQIIENYVDFCFNYKRASNTLSKASVGQMKKIRNNKEYGFSIGLNGWTDISMLKLKNKRPRVMVVMKDWYPLIKQESFLIESEEKIQTEYLEHNVRIDPEELYGCGVYFTNAMLCYKAGGDKSGDNNVSEYSFNLCEEHLKTQISMIQPEILIAFGNEAATHCWSCLKWLKNKKKPQKKQYIQVTKVKNLPYGDSNWGGIKFFPLAHPSWQSNMIKGNSKNNYNSLRLELKKLAKEK